MVPGSARLAAGATAAGFGAGLTVIPIAETIENFGYHLAFLVFGLGQGLVVILSSWFLRAPVNGAEEPPSAQRRKIMQTRIDYLPAQVLGQPMFWLMYLIFGMAGLSLVLLTQLGHNPWLFVLLTALFFGVFGEIYSLFPATCGDTFGSKYATTNAGLLYTAKGTASALVPLASIAGAAYGWSAVFAIAVAFNLGAALLALFVLKPLLARFLQRSSAHGSGSSSLMASVPSRLRATRRNSTRL
jgi:OFA family oxalate/formate antiporter-like MFS transporter